MLYAKRVGFWRNRYEISIDGRPLTVWRNATWRTGGSFELVGLRYNVRANLWGSRYGMATAHDGRPVAKADHVSRKRWTITANDRTYDFERPSIWRHEQRLMLAGQPVGSIKRTGMWRRDVVAELPGLPLPVQLFALIVVLTMWDQQEHSSS